MADKNPKPITDVEKPGKTPAAATSRPIIVGHGSPLKDPMVTDDKAITQEKQSTDKPTRAGSKVVKPLSNPNPEPKKPEEEPKPETTNASEISDQAVVDAVIEKAGDKKQNEKEAEELHKRLELVEQLVSSKKYFVPIDVAAKKRTHRIELALFLLLLLVVAGAVLAIDAGVINTDLKLPFDLIKSAP